MEDMIRDPLGFARTVFGQVGLDPASCADVPRTWARRVQDEDNDDFGEAECTEPYSRPDHRTKVGRRRENLSAAEAAELVSLVGPAAARFGYALPRTRKAYFFSSKRCTSRWGKGMVMPSASRRCLAALVRSNSSGQ
jgi:hypothetical protein